MGTLAWLLVLACAPPGDARRYALAMSEAEDWPEARELCQGIREPSSRGDCLVGAMERFSTLDPAECQDLQQAEPEMAVWRDECMFQLAERHRGRGDFDLAMDTCLETRFARECFWHLVRDEAEASLGETEVVAEGRVARFLAAGPIPDAGLQFWSSRNRAQSAAGTAPDEAGCAGLKDPASCEEALRRFVRSRLDSRWRLDPERTCADTAPDSALAPMGLGFEPGPVANGTVERWRTRHCAGAVQPVPSPVPPPG